jgi:hypothetical protein
MLALNSLFAFVVPHEVAMQWQTTSRGAAMASAEHIIFKCLARLRHWRVPANYDCAEWRKELAAVGAYATILAEQEYDSSRGVPHDAFVYQRVLTAMVTHYRQEWRFVFRYRSELNFSGALALPSSPAFLREVLTYNMPNLSEAERYLVASLFGEGRTEAELAAQWGVTQQSISKRKAAILKRLRQDLNLVSHRVTGNK